MQINRKALTSKSAGFTLIELLIVIIIIGILAAIGFVAYTGSQNKAKKADAEATLSQLRSKLAEYHATEEGYPADKAAVVTYLKSDDGGNNDSLGDKFEDQAKYEYEATPDTCTTDCTGYTITAKGSLWNGTDGTDDVTVNN